MIKSIVYIIDQASPNATNRDPYTHTETSKIAWLIMAVLSQKTSEVHKTEDEL